jgi:hypothetical protein
MIHHQLSETRSEINIQLLPGSVLSIIDDDGPSGICGQSMSITCPHTAIHWFPNEDLYRAWREAGDCHRRGRNVRERIVVIGQWSSPGEIGVNIHEA